MVNINCGLSTAFVYGSGQAPLELITNDLLKNIFKPMLGLPDYAAVARVSKGLQKKIQPILDEEWNKVLKTITFGRDKWLTIPGVTTVSDEPSFTEGQLKRIKAKFGEACQVFNKPDPIQPHRFQNDKIKKTWATHMLIFFPEFINNDRRTLNVIGRLFRFEKECDEITGFECILGSDDMAYRNRSPLGSYWRAVPRDIFPESRSTSYHKKMEIIKSEGYVAPSPCDAATAMRIMNLGHSHGDGDYFFSRGRGGKYSTFTITDTEFQGRSLVVGALPGLHVNTVINNDIACVGVLGFAEIL